MAGKCDWCRSSEGVVACGTCGVAACAECRDDADSDCPYCANIRPRLADLVDYVCGNLEIGPDELADLWLADLWRDAARRRAGTTG